MQISSLYRRIARSLAAALWLAGACTMPAHAAGIVGTGTAASCTEAAFDSALTGGGTVKFNCGAAPVTIKLTTTKIITQATDIQGSGLVTLDGKSAVQLFKPLQANLSLSGLNLVNGKSFGNGGAIYASGPLVLSLSGVGLTNNQAVLQGGAIFAVNSVTVNLAYVKADGNNADIGGVITTHDSSTLVLNQFVLTNNYSHNGGGALRVLGVGLTIDTGLFDSNYASGLGAAGGAIEFNPELPAALTLSIVNATFNNNGSGSGTTGAAISINSVPNATINNSIFADNKGQGAIEVYGNAKVTLTNTIISNSKTNFQNCLINNGTISDGGNNLQFAGNVPQSCGATIPEVDPKLGMLSNNGGFSLTMPLQAGSPAIDAGNDAACAPKDQRGVSRPQGPHCDIGAFEAFAPPKITNGPPPDGTVGTGYLFIYTGTGNAPVTFSLSAGALPPGLSLTSGGTLSGIPTTTGTFTGTVTASDGVGPDATQNFSITIAPAAVGLTISNGPPPNGTVGTNYSFIYKTTGSTPQLVSFSLSAGTLPPGLTLASDGTLSGIPTTAGTFTGTVKASDGIGPDATQDFSIIIAAAPVAPTITNGPAPNGTVGTPYNFTYTATGSTPITFAFTGTLPPGLVLQAATGTITGTPTTLGTFTGTMIASNGTLPNATQNFSITISPSTQPQTNAVPAPTLGGGALATLMLLLMAFGFRYGISVRNEKRR